MTAFANVLNLLKCNAVKYMSTQSTKSNLNNLILSMSREKTHLNSIRRRRVELREKGRKYAPGNLYLQVLGSGARGMPRSLYVFTDHTRYLFNCSEGTQRLAIEHKCKLAKLEHIFITSSRWDNIGGLPGMALSAQDVGVPHITLHGPEGTDELFRATRRFVVLRSLEVSMAAEEAETFEDEAMTVRYVRLTKESPAGKRSDDSSDTSDSSLDFTDSDTDYYEHYINSNGKRLKVETNNDSTSSKPKRKLFESSRIPIHGVTAYVCKIKPRAGALLLEQCVEKGVPPGPLLGLLKQGQDVTLPDGTVVRSSDVRMPDDPGAVFIVVECPSIDYLDSLVRNPAFEAHQRPTVEDNQAFCVIHFTPEHIMANPKYRAWMDKFGPSTINLILNERNVCMGSEAVHRMQHKLHMIHPKIFPLLNQDGHRTKLEATENVIEGREPDTRQEVLEKSETQAAVNGSLCLNNETNLVKTLNTIHLLPQRSMDLSLGLALQPELYVAEAMADSKSLDALAELHTALNAKTKELGNINEYPKVVFLGTGSCAPNKTRNTSGILFRINEANSILLDCGEGTLTQIMRFYKKDEALQVLASIKAIYVSHLHADHHIGLFGVLKARERVTHQPVYVLAPRQITPWLIFYNRKFEPILNSMTLLQNQSFLFNEHTLPAWKKEQLYTSLGVSEINTVFVRHVQNSFGISITLNNGYKVTYSGDTMPAPSLIEIGMDSDLLIHEATMEDELEEEARLKLHSTTSEAVEVGKKMNARFIMLTHFSQRYAKMPRLPDGVGHMIGIAFDNMEVRCAELPILPLLYPAFCAMFSEACQELDDRAARRKLRQQFK